MYNILKSLRTRKSQFIIVIFQLALGMSLLNYSLSLVNTNESKVNSLQEIYKFDRTYLTKMQSSIDLTNYEKLKEIINDLEILKKRGIIKEYLTQYSYPFLQIDSLEEKLFDEEMYRKKNGNFFIAPITIINESFFNRTSIRTVKGRAPKKEDFYKDFSKENIPIWLGKNYIDKVNIGDEFTTEGTQQVIGEEPLVKDITFEIAGILDDYQIPTIHGKENLKASLGYTNYLLIIPEVPNFFDYNSEVALNDFGLFVELQSSSMFEEYEKNIKAISEKYKYKHTIFPLANEFRAKAESLTRELYQTLIIGSTLTILSIVGIVSILLGSIKDRKSEFGIKLAVGASLKRIIKEVILEVILLVSCATIISFIILFFKKVTIIYSFKFLLINLLFILVIISIILIPLIIKLKKFTTIELIRK